MAEPQRCVAGIIRLGGLENMLACVRANEHAIVRKSKRGGRKIERERECVCETGRWKLIGANSSFSSADLGRAPTTGEIKSRKQQLRCHRVPRVLRKRDDKMREYAGKEKLEDRRFYLNSLLADSFPFASASSVNSLSLSPFSLSLPRVEKSRVIMLKADSFSLAMIVTATNRLAPVVVVVVVVDTVLALKFNCAIRRAPT